MLGVFLIGCSRAASGFGPGQHSRRHHHRAIGDNHFGRLHHLLSDCALFSARSLGRRSMFYLVKRGLSRIQRERMVSKTELFWKRQAQEADLRSQCRQDKPAYAA